MSTFNKSKLEVLLISKPNSKPNDVNIKFDKHQDFSGFKISVNKRRNDLKKYSNIKNVSLLGYSNQIGVNYQSLLKYINKQNIGLGTSSKIYNALKDVDFKKLTSDAIKHNKVLKSQPKKEIDYKGKHKTAIRNLLVRYFAINNIKWGKFFTLPSSKCLFEIQMNLAFDNKFKYVACECDDKNYAEMINTMITKNVNLTTIHKGMSHELTSLLPTDSLSHGFWDYCLTYATHENEVKQVLQNKTVRVGGLIAFTFCQRDETTKSYHREVLKELGSKATPNVKGGITHKLKALVSDNYVIKEVQGYRDGSPMVFVLLKRIK